MAEWKKIIFETSKASLDGVAIADIDSTSGDIATQAAPGLKLSATTAIDTTLTGELSVVISGSGDGLEQTGSNAFQSSMASNPLVVPAAGGLNLEDDGTVVSDYDGLTSLDLTFDSASLSGKGLISDTNERIDVGGSTSVTVNANDIDVTTALADTAKGLKTFGTSIGIHTGSGVSFSDGALFKLAPNESGAGSNVGVAGNLLTGGNGITVSNTSYDYADAETITLSVDDFTGTGLVSTANDLNLATSSLLEGTGSKWNGSQLQGTNISEGTDTILMAGANVLAPGLNFNVAGTANYGHESDFEISDRILLINSASSQFGATAQFGFLGQTGSAAHGISMFYSGSGTTGDIGWNVGTMANIGTDEPGVKKGRVRMHIGSEATGNPNSTTFTAFQTVVGNSFSDELDEGEGLYIYV
tara:strand:- start:1241 stop:2485 length:1245 start_codon:yes stop_codon:yes gene_type:complete